MRRAGGWVGRRVRSMVPIVATFMLAGCSLGQRGVKFTNVSESWLNVQYYVGPDGAGPERPGELVRRRALQVAPGGSVSYRPRHELVHVQVEMVSPTWVPTGREYWIELLTEPPVHIVADGREDRLEFRSFDGEVAIIPDREREERYTYLSAPRRGRKRDAAGDESALTTVPPEAEGWDE